MREPTDWKPAACAEDIPGPLTGITGEPGIDGFGVGESCMSLVGRDEGISGVPPDLFGSLLLLSLAAGPRRACAALLSEMRTWAGACKPLTGWGMSWTGLGLTGTLGGCEPVALPVMPAAITLEPVEAMTGEMAGLLLAVVG